MIRMAAKAGVHTALDLVRAHDIQQRFGMVLARTQTQLRGVSCAELEVSEPQRQQIIVSRSFGREVISLADLQQAASNFAQRVCEKLPVRELQP